MSSNMARLSLIAVLIVAEWCLLRLPKPPAPPVAVPSSPQAPSVARSPQEPSPTRIPPAERARRQLERLARETAQLRHLEYRRAVPSSPVTRQQFRSYAERELDKDTEWRAEEARLEEFGLIPRGYGLRSHLLDFFATQVLGFYDPATGSYHMVTADPKGVGQRAMELGWDLVQPGARIDQEESAMVHELDHALTDQHFHLETVQKKARKLSNSDVTTAVQSLIEGDATVIMYHAQDSRLGLDPEYSQLTSTTAETVQLLQDYVGGTDFNSYPLYFRRLALFPYLYGGVFVDHHRSLRGWQSLNAMYGHLPASTEQILHPEKYLEALDPPILVHWHGKQAEAPVGWTTVTSDSMGEFHIRLIFECAGFSSGEAASWAADWGGDSVRIFESKTHPGERFLVWVSTWDNEAAARRFSAGLVKWACKRVGLKPAPGLPWSASAKSGTLSRIERWGRRVVYLQGVPPGLQSRCLDMARAAVTAPMSAPGFAVGPLY